jgi:3-methyladenine DNA glycosylase AlkC
MSEPFLLKGYLFNESTVLYLAHLLQRSDPLFPVQLYTQTVLSRFPDLSLKERITWMAEVLERYVPCEYEAAVAVLQAALPPPLEPTRTDDDFGDFIFAPFGEYVVRNGCTKERLQISLNTLRELTMRFSMEDSVRYFLRAFPTETLAEMDTWVQDENYHVRRLVSEGMRPRLPWSGRVSIPWTVRREFLTTLHADRARYVVRSVANHLNDEAKENPDGVLEVLREWQSAKMQSEKELTWLIRHALRTLIKDGHTGALQFLGYESGRVKIINFSVTPLTVLAGERIALHLALESKTSTRVLIDYRIGFVKKSGERTAKVFKWTERSLKIGEKLSLIKPHHFKADATTFTLYPGEHTVSVQINGEVLVTKKFQLTN